MDVEIIDLSCPDSDFRKTVVIGIISDGKKIIITGPKIIGQQTIKNIP